MDWNNNQECLAAVNSYGLALECTRKLQKTW